MSGGLFCGVRNDAMMSLESLESLSWLLSLSGEGVIKSTAPLPCPPQLLGGIALSLRIGSGKITAALSKRLNILRSCYCRFSFLR